MRGGGGPGLGVARVVCSGGRSVGVRVGEGASRRGWGGWALAGVRWEVVRDLIQVASLIVLQTMEVMLRTSCYGGS